MAEVHIRIDMETTPSLWYVGTDGIMRRLDVDPEHPSFEPFSMREEGIVKAMLTYAQGHFIAEDKN